MMKRIFIYIFPVLCALMASSCIENDLSFPRVAAEFLSLEVEDADSVLIDKAGRNIRIVLNEVADITSVKVKSVTLSEGASFVGDSLDVIDLTDSLQVTIRVYEDFVWTISATQPIARYIRCDNQVGEAEIDPVRKMAYVYVLDTQSLQEIRINEMKLEPAGSEIVSTVGFVSEAGSNVAKTEKCSFPMVLDCVLMRYFHVEYDEQTIEWSVKFLQKQVAVELNHVDPWSHSAIVKGTTDGKGTYHLEYRKETDQDWKLLEGMTFTGTTVKAHLTGLDPETSYLTRLTNGTQFSDEMSFTTAAAEQLANLSFDDWYQEGAAWMPNAGADSYVWDSANPGTAGLGIVPTVPESSDVVKGKAARLETMTAMGMLAAGNIYVGHFGNIAGLGAELDWGYQFTSRPVALKGYYKYAPKPIDMAKDPYKNLIGEGDQCQIQILLTDWEDRFHINTSKKQFVDFENDSNIIAHGALASSETDQDYVEFTVPLKYRSSRTPKYIVIVGAASRYGDYFTGGKGSVLKLDEFELVYDPTQLTEEEYNIVFNNIL